MTNPLVATAVDTSTPFQGAFLLEDGEALVNAIQSGNWVDGGLAAFSAIGDTVAAVMDPLGSLIAAGLGWVMEHLEPLKGWLNDLTGDAGEVAAFAQTWSNISAQLSASGDELVRILADLDSADGEAVQAYLRFQSDAAEHIRAAGTWADAMSMGMQTASMMVQLVHDLTRDAIAQVVGSVISYAATLVVSLGTATPYVVAQATSRVSALATRVGTTVTKLLRSGDELMKLIDELGALFRKLDDLASKVLPGGGRGGGRPGHAPDGPGHAPDGGTPGWRNDPAAVDFRDDIEEIATRNGPDGYDPTGGLGWDRFMDEYFGGFDSSGHPKWVWPDDPPHTNGFQNGVSHPADLGVGDVIDRITFVGTDGLPIDGSFAAPPGTRFDELALPPDRLDDSAVTLSYRVLKPLPDDIRVGEIAPGFGQGGGGTQYFFPSKINDLVSRGYLEVLT